MGSVFPLANAANPHSSIAMAFFRAATEQALWRTPSFNARVGLTFGGVFLLLPLSLPRRVTDHVVTKTGEAANFARKAHGRFWQPAMLGTLLGRSSSSRLSAANCTLDVDRYDIKALLPISIATYNALHALQPRLCLFHLVEKSNRLSRCPGVTTAISALHRQASSIR